MASSGLTKHQSNAPVRMAVNKEHVADVMCLTYTGFFWVVLTI
jgi:hypothetical protein